MKKQKEEQAISDNGHDKESSPFLEKILEGVGGNIDDLIFIEGQDHIDIEQKLGVLQRLVTAVLDDKQYRQQLLASAFDNKAEAMLCADAISERRRYGVAITPIVDRIVAQCAVNGKRANSIMETINSYTLRTNQYQPKWKKQNDAKGIR